MISTNADPIFEEEFSELPEELADRVAELA